MTISWTCESLGGHKVLCPWFLLISQAKLRSLNSPPVALQNGQKASETRHEVSHEAAFHPTVARDVWPVLLSLSLNSSCCYGLQIWPSNPSTTRGRSPRSSSLPPRTLYDFPPRTCAKMTKDYATWRLASACSGQLQQTFKFRSRKLIW